MLKVVITNLKDYCREVQFFRRNQWRTVAPNSTMVFTELDEKDTIAISYYKSLTNSGFEVKFISENSEQESSGRVTSDTTYIENNSSEESVEVSSLSDEQIKGILSLLGVSTRCKKRWKLEELLLSSLPEGENLSNYLQRL